MSETTAAPEWRPAAKPWLIAVAAFLATCMEVLDTSVANVSLPHIAGSLSATNEEATWVLTSYLISNAIILPATGWLGGRYGRKRFLLPCIAIFTLSAAFRGTATSRGMDPLVQYGLLRRVRGLRERGVTGEGAGGQSARLCRSKFSN